MEIPFKPAGDELTKKFIVWYYKDKDKNKR